MEKFTVAEARRMRNLSQDDVAKQLGISTSAYRNKESGESKFYYDEAVTFCEMVNLKLDDISFTADGAKN